MLRMRLKSRVSLLTAINKLAAILFYLVTVFENHCKMSHWCCKLRPFLVMIKHCACGGGGWKPFLDISFFLIDIPCIFLLVLLRVDAFFEVAFHGQNCELYNVQNTFLIKRSKLRSSVPACQLFSNFLKINIWLNKFTFTFLVLFEK